MFSHPPETRLVALDLETTGLSAATDRIVEFAAVAWQDGREIGVFHALVHPGRPIPPAAIAVHGITDAMVADQPPVDAVLPAFLAFCAAADLLIAHNAAFDLGFLRAACERQGLPCLTAEVADSCRLARRRLPDAPNYRLATLKQMLGLGHEPSHRALADARDCLALYLHCLRTPLPAPLTVSRLPDQAHVALLQHTLATGGTVMIEYQDGRGRATRREIRPLQFDAQCLVVEAYCLLRRDTCHFHLDRVRNVWAVEAEA